MIIIDIVHPAQEPSLVFFPSTAFYVLSLDLMLPCACAAERNDNTILGRIRKIPLLYQLLLLILVLIVLDRTLLVRYSLREETQLRRRARENAGDTYLFGVYMWW